MKRLNYEDAMALTAQRLANGGAFLNVGGEKPNTMTIGWAALGCIWNRPVLTVLVRPQRHTYELLEGTNEFTVSVPTSGDLKAQLAFAGTRSGRDVDKFDGHGITAAPAQAVNAPIVRECGLHFECRILLRQDMTGDRMDENIRTKAYPSGDYHTMYFGEIVECYTTDE